MRIAYESWRPGAQARAMVGYANEICADYAAQGYDLTLRQLYYQFVSRGLLSNTQRRATEFLAKPLVFIHFLK